MSEWKPIETAPRNGASMLLYRPWTSGRPTIFISFYANGWVVSVGADEDYSEVSPTHWMPLPEPPK